MKSGFSIGVSLVSAALVVLAADSRAWAIAGTAWNLPRTRFNLQVGGFGRLRQRGFGTLDMVFGPDAGEALAANEFKATDHDGNVFTGTFAQGRGSRITLNLDLGVMQQFLEDQIELHTTAENVTVSINRVRTTVRGRAGRRIRLSTRISYTAMGDYLERRKRGVGRYQLRGNGTPQ